MGVGRGGRQFVLVPNIQSTPSCWQLLVEAGADVEHQARQLLNRTALTIAVNGNNPATAEGPSVRARVCVCVYPTLPIFVSNKISNFRPLPAVLLEAGAKFDVEDG